MSMDEFIRYLVLLATVSAGVPALGFESARVLPQGVRQLAIRGGMTQVRETTDDAGVRIPLAQPFNRPVTLGQLVAAEEGMAREQAQAYLTARGIDPQTEVGSFRGDLESSVAVVAPVLAWGITDRLTLAVAVPFYRAETAVDVEFEPSESAQAFVDGLGDPGINQRERGRQIARRINAGVMSLHERLAAHGYSPLERWSASGLGDVTAQARYLLAQGTRWGLAGLGGLAAPTGRVDDPDILTDVPFGDGSWDVAAGILADQVLAPELGLFLNEHVRYTYQAPARGRFRLKTVDESIAVPVETLRYRLGSRVDLGASVQLELSRGWTGGVGLDYFSKEQDLYDTLGKESILGQGSAQSGLEAEAGAGYSTVAAYQRAEAAIPIRLQVSLVRHLASRNAPVRDLAKFEMGVFF